MTNQRLRDQLGSAYARVRDSLLSGHIEVADLSAEACAGLWLHTFGDATRALAALCGDAATRRYYDKRFPRLRELLEAVS